MPEKKKEAAAPAQQKEGTTMVEKREAGQKKETVAYVGPYIKGIVAENTIFNNGIPEGLQNAAKEIPAIQRLIVPIRQVNNVKKELMKNESAVAVCYKEAKNYGKERDK